MGVGYNWSGGGVVQSVELHGKRTALEIALDDVPNTDAPAIDAWDRAVLSGAKPRLVEGGGRGRVRIVDLFCGAGGLSLGVLQGLKAAGYSPVVELAGDLDRTALDLFNRNLGPGEIFHGDVSDLVQAPIQAAANGPEFTHEPWVRDRRLAARLTGVDVLIGGPPCQGHSNLNNHTRRADPRNELYLAMPAMAIALNIPVVIIENVPEVRRDHYRVVAQTKHLFNEAGYTVAAGVLSATALGLPQTRRRFFLVAVKTSLPLCEVPLLEELIRPLHRPARDLRWAIGDLECRPLDGFHSASELSPRNQRRVDFLFEHGVYDLPDSQRPECHQNGHSYPSVYGRLRWDKPAGTVTTGFLTPGRGRFIHPSQRRALTPHEAARIQGFPDSFRFELGDGSVPPRNALAKVIGDAVPPIMGQAAMLAAIQLREAEGQRRIEAAA